MTAAAKGAAFSAAGLGVLCIGLYALLFWNAERVVALCAEPGVMAALFPVGVALVFSFVHGAFTGKFWDALGVKPRGRREPWERQIRALPDSPSTCPWESWPRRSRSCRATGPSPSSATMACAA